MSKVWFSSDFHFGHTNICGPKISSWSGGYRNFNSVEQMDHIILDGINKYVAPEDTLYFLGDFCFGGHVRTPLYRSRIACQTIHVCRGNHDHKIDLYNSSFNSIQDTITIEKKEYQMFMSHYPHLSWLGSAKGYIMLHGHEHGMINHLNNNSRRLDVGIDSAYKLFGEYRPFSLEEILNFNFKKPILELGHHSKLTNVR